MNNRHVLRYLITSLVISIAFIFGPGVTPSSAQQQQPPAVKEMPKDRPTILVNEWTRARLGVKEYIEAMPEDAIGFKPTPEIRSFAEQMLHLAGGNYMFAAVASGKENPWDFTKGKDPVNVPEFKANKAALLKFVMESYDFAIDAVKGLTSAQLDEVVQLFNMKMPRHMLLAKGIEHAAHHRGQTTIYLRLKGITPPSERLF